MMNSTVVADPPLPRELTESDLSFLAEYLKADLGVAKDRVVTLWNNINASGVHVYRCIKEFYFLTPSVSRKDRHKKIIEKYRQEGKRPLWLEIGCAFGTDLRKMILSGWPSEDIIGLDVVPDYWQLGNQLYGDTPCRFLQKDIAKPTSLDDLPQVDVVYTSAVLHVLQKDQTFHLVSNIFKLLRPGGFYFGGTIGSEPEGFWLHDRWLHSETSLKELLESVGFVDVFVIKAKFEDLEAGKVLTVSQEFKTMLGERIYLGFRASKV